jgi:hypothetical protein
VTDEDGRTDHYVNDGSIIAVERYAGHSQAEKSSSGGGGGGGGGGDGTEFGWFLLIASPLLLVLGITALFVCPGLWLLVRVFGKKSAPGPNAAPRFVGAGWVILAMLMMVASLTALAGALSGFGTALNSAYPTGGRYGSLIIGGICASWVGSLVLGAIDILRKNRATTILWSFVFLAGLEAFGWFVAFRNSPRTRLLPKVVFGTTPSTSGPEKSGARTANVLLIGRVSPVAPRQAQTITIRGSGFGTRPAYTGDSDAIRVSDLTRNWNAGWANDPGGDKVTLSVASWTDTRIVIAGFGGAYGSEQNSVAAGDNLSFQVWNAQSGVGPAVFKVVASPR